MLWFDQLRVNGVQGEGGLALIDTTDFRQIKPPAQKKQPSPSAYPPVNRGERFSTKAR